VLSFLTAYAHQRSTIRCQNALLKLDFLSSLKQQLAKMYNSLHNALYHIVVLFRHIRTCCSWKITDRSFRYASSHLKLVYVMNLLVYFLSLIFIIILL